MEYLCTLMSEITPEITSPAQPVETHRSGFVSLLGRPNAGKSTLLNAFMGEKLSAVTYKAQTTRHRIFGIYNTDEEQIVFSDTPGVLESAYELHRLMMTAVRESLEDADLLLLLLDATRPPDDAQAVVKLLARKREAPLYVIINKIDAEKTSKTQITELRAWAEENLKPERIYEISALEGTGVEALMADVKEAMPIHPPYFDKEQLSDRTERFFASEIIREKIFLNYREEVPYACEVVVEAFKEEETIIRVRAEIFVERPTQKGILIGKGGEALKKTATEAREEMEKFFAKKIFLEVFVKVKPDWRNERTMLRRLGYGS